MVTAVRNQRCATKEMTRRSIRQGLDHLFECRRSIRQGLDHLFECRRCGSSPAGTWPGTWAPPARRSRPT